jgi:hypothetical protein
MGPRFTVPKTAGKNRRHREKLQENGSKPHKCLESTTKAKKKGFERDI